MQSNELKQTNPKNSSVSAQARLLMSQSRQQQQNRSQSMLQRSAAALGLER